MTAIVGSRAETATPAGQWQAVPMDAVVLILFLLLLLGIVVAILWTAAVALDRSKTG